MAPPSGDPLGQVVRAPAPRPSGPNVAQQLATLKARLEADPRPRYVVNKQRMDHGPFNAVELLQQIASNQFVGTDELRDELSGQSRPISEWEEFAPFAQHAKIARDIKHEKKEVARVESAEKKSGAAKVIISVALILAVGSAAAVVVLQGARLAKRRRERRGRERARLSTSTAASPANPADGAAAGAAEAAAARGAAGAAGSAEATKPRSTRTTSRSTSAAAAGPISPTRSSAGRSRTRRSSAAAARPTSMKVTVKVAVKMGRAVGVSVYTHAAERRGRVVHRSPRARPVVAGQPEDGFRDDAVLTPAGLTESDYCCPGAFGRHAGTGPLKQYAPMMQSLSVSHGNAHLPYCVLHLWVMHIESFEHGSAAGPGTAS